jgi:hypothetical protein
VGTISSTALPKGESITMEPGGRSILLGSEGNDSPIVRVALPSTLAPVAPTTTPSSSASGQRALPPVTPVAPDVTPAKSANVTVGSLITIAIFGVVVAVAAAVHAVRRRQRLARRHRRMAEHDHR